MLGHELVSVSVPHHTTERSGDQKNDQNSDQETSPKDLAMDSDMAAANDANGYSDNLNKTNFTKI